MEFKQVYLYDGTPYLAFKNSDGEYDYPEDEWTEEAPPPGIYSPYYYNGNEWVGATQDEYNELRKSEEEETSDYQPPQSILQMAETQMQVAESAYHLKSIQSQLAQTILDTTEKDERIKNLEKQQAQLLLEIAELKGEE